MSTRTTLTLDDDVAARLQAEARRSGRSFREVVNELLRLGLAGRRAEPPPPFRVHARPMGLKAGLSYDDVAGLLDEIE